jgi:hypothetical protein
MGRTIKIKMVISAGESPSHRRVIGLAGSLISIIKFLVFKQSGSTVGHTEANGFTNSRQLLI